MIKINLVGDRKVARGAGAAPAAMSGLSGANAPANLNNILLGGLIGVGLLLALAYWFTNNRTLANRQQQVATRQAEAQKLESIIAEVEAFQKRKDSLQNRIDLINQLKQNQKGPVRIMDRISQDLPDLVWLDKMTVAAGTVSVTGRGLNPNAIANFVENIKNDPYFEEPELGNVSETAGVRPVIYTFDMTFGFTYQPKAADGSAGTAGTTSTAPPGAAPGGTGAAR